MTAALSMLLKDVERRCIEAVGDGELCKKAVDVALKALVNRSVYVAGRPAYVTAWVANYETVRFGVNDAGEVVLEFSGRGLPTISIYVKDKIRTVVEDENYIAMHNHHDRDILRMARKIVKKT
jgi:hypothetical protein